MEEWMPDMGKRSNFKRVDRDYYPTPFEAVIPLQAHLKDGRFVEPCAGNGLLITHLEKLGMKCIDAFDIEPQTEGIREYDAFDEFEAPLIITNPPWDRKILHPLIDHFITISPTWLLFDSDWMHTKQSIPYLEYCSKIVSVGRVKWFGNTSGKDNACWYFFENEKKETTFFGRQKQ